MSSLQGNAWLCWYIMTTVYNFEVKSFMLRWDVGHGFKYELRRGFIDCPHLLIVSRLLSIGTSIVRVRPYYDAAVVISCTQHHFLLNEFGRSDCLSYTYIAEKRLVKWNLVNWIRCAVKPIHKGRKNIILHGCQKIKCRGADVWKPAW